MSNQAKQYTLEEAHRHFAIEFNSQVWKLLQKKDRTQIDNDQMVYAAYASAPHWLIAGNGLNQQRAEWLIANVFNTLGLADSALRHANRCLELTNQFSSLMHDFDHAYAFEAAARANALAGNIEQAHHYLPLAVAAGQAIQHDGDRVAFESDFGAGNWYGVK